VRAFTIAAVGCGLAAAAHGSSGGGTAWWVTVLGVVLAARLMRPMTRRRVGIVPLVTATAALQWVMHLAFALTEQPPGPISMAMSMDGHTEAMSASMHQTPRTAFPGTLLLGWGDGRMVVAHLAVAAVFGFYLAVLERQVWALATRTGRRLAGRIELLVRLLVRPLPIATRAGRQIRSRRERHRSPGRLLLAGSVDRRGPPAAGAIVCC
jgi:hypothetical protein